MNEDVGDSRVSLLDRVLHFVREIVPGSHRHSLVHANVKIDVILEAHFADKAFVDLHDSRHLGGRGPDALDNFPLRRGVEHFTQGRIKQSPAIGRNQDAGK